MGRNKAGDSIMQLLVNSQNIIQLVREITWSGDTKEVSRKLSFVIYQNAADKLMPTVSIKNGDEVLFIDNNGKTLFGGVIHKVTKKSQEKTYTYLAYDLLFYVSKSEISKIFNSTPEAITRTICNELGIPIRNIAATNINVYYPCIQKTAYEAIMIAYTQAKKHTGNMYIPLMQDINKLSIIALGAYCGVVVEGTYNLIDATYDSSSEEVVNKVVIVDEKGNTLKTLDDISSRNAYGTIQKVYKKEDGVDPTAGARELFHAIDQTGSIVALGDTRAVAGYSLAVQESRSGLYGLFYIESDSHSFMDGKHEMSLTLAFANTMDEKELPKDETK